MNKFFNNLKRKFTAPKTRDMQKKIESMEDYLGPAKKKFEQMKTDAEFYKGKQEELSLAQRKLKSGGKLFTNYIAEILYKEKTYKVNPSASPSAFLTGVTDYKSDTLKNNENYIKERKELGEEFRESSMGFSNAVRTQTSEVKNDRDVKALSTTQCSELLKKGEEFCRKYKQEIKDIFEEKKKQFSKEKTALKELSDLAKGFEEGKKPKETLDKWDKIREWQCRKFYSVKPLEKNDTAQEEVYTQIYELAKKIVPTAIENWIKTESEKICASMSGKNKHIVWNKILTFAGDLKIYQIFYSELTGKKIDERKIELYKQNINDKWNEVFPENAQLLPF